MPRRPRNHRPDLNGLLLIDKPIGLTSMDVCRRVRSQSGGAKVGHAGTLDPLATGVLVLCLGDATKAIPRVMNTEKRYRAAIDLSAFSTTDDMEGEASPIFIADPPNRASIERMLQSVLGRIMQRPPAFSAAHIQGQRSYKLARRQGSTTRPDARLVVIYAIEILDYAWPILTLDIRCGKGVYVRSLARDLGEAMGTGGRVRSLRRTAVGQYTIERAISLEALPGPLMPEHLLPTAG